jgi:hypothetical protein
MAGKIYMVSGAKIDLTNEQVNSLKKLIREKGLPKDILTITKDDGDFGGIIIVQNIETIHFD